MKVLGSLSGPVFGSFLYFIGGYLFPFIVLGACLVVMSFFISTFLRISNDNNNKEENFNYISYLNDRVKIFYENFLKIILFFLYYNKIE